MAGYEYRGTDSRRRRAEEFTRRREAAESARKLRVRREKKPARQTARPAPTEETPVMKSGEEKPVMKISDSPNVTAGTPAPVGEFDVVREDPPTRPGARTGAVAAAASAAVAVLVDSPGEWFRVANRDTRAKASAYASALRALDQRVETRTVLADDGKGGVLYARVNTLTPRGAKK